MNVERTLVIIKPDGIQKGATGEIISRFERKGLKIVGMKMIKMDRKLAKEHYAHLADKVFRTRVGGVDGNGGVAEHRLRPGRSHSDVFNQTK